MKRLEKNQTIKKGETYLYTGTGYSCGRGYNYVKMYVVRAKVDHFFTVPAHWNEDVFEMLDGSGKVYYGSTDASEGKIREAEFKAEYPGIIEDWQIHARFSENKKHYGIK